MSKPVSTPSTEGICSDWEKARNNIFGIAAASACCVGNICLGLNRFLAGEHNLVPWIHVALAVAGTAMFISGIIKHRRQFYPESLTPKP